MWAYFNVILLFHGDYLTLFDILGMNIWWRHGKTDSILVWFGLYTSEPN